MPSGAPNFSKSKDNFGVPGGAQPKILYCVYGPSSNPGGARAPPGSAPMLAIPHSRYFLLNQAILKHNPEF